MGRKTRHSPLHQIPGPNLQTPRGHTQPKYIVGLGKTHRSAFTPSPFSRKTASKFVQKGLCSSRVLDGVSRVESCSRRFVQVVKRHTSRGRQVSTIHPSKQDVFPDVYTPCSLLNANNSACSPVIVGSTKTTINSNGCTEGCSYCILVVWMPGFRLKQQAYSCTEIPPLTCSPHRGVRYFGDPPTARGLRGPPRTCPLSLHPLKDFVRCLRIRLGRFLDHISGPVVKRGTTGRVRHSSPPSDLQGLDQNEADFTWIINITLVC